VFAKNNKTIQKAGLDCSAFLAKREIITNKKCKGR